jgi:hypothetical protein
MWKGIGDEVHETMFFRRTTALKKGKRKRETG